MSSFRRLSPTVLAWIVVGAGASIAGVVTSAEVPKVDTAIAKPAQTIDAQAFERLPAGRNAAELLLLVPPPPGGFKYNHVAIGGAGSALDGAQPTYVSPGWSWSKGGNFDLTGPAGSTPGGFKVKLLLPKAKQPLGYIDLKLYDGKKELPKIKLPTIQLNPGKPITDPKGAILLPPVISPGQKIHFVPRDPKYTPGGGDWKIGGFTPSWNGSFGKPQYELELPYDFAPPLPLKVSYVSPWGEKLVDGAAEYVDIRRETVDDPGPGEVTGCSPGTLAGDSFCLCGSFPEGSTADLRLNGFPIDDLIVANTDAVLSLALPRDFPPGPLAVTAVPGSAIEVRDGASGLLLRVAGEIDRSKLLRGESTSLRLKIAGSDRPISLKLWNNSPGVVSLEGGESQLVTTSGGATNEVERGVHAVTPGDFEINYKLTIDSCPCARTPVELLYDTTDSTTPEAGGNDDAGKTGELPKVTLPKEPSGPAKEAGPAPGSGGETTSAGGGGGAGESAGTNTTGQHDPGFGKYVLDDWKLGKDAWTFSTGFTTAKGTKEECTTTRESCEELRKRAEEAEATARALRAQAGYARENQKWLDEQAAKMDEAAAKDEAQVQELMRQAAAQRELERSALARSGQAQEKARARPGTGWEELVVKAQEQAAEFAGFAGGLEIQAQDLARLAASKRSQAAGLRGAESDALAAAQEADRLAYLARAAYLDCLDEVRSHCGGQLPAVDPVPIAGGGAHDQVPPAGSGPPPQGGQVEILEKAKPNYCGPDISAMYTAALRRVFQRVQALPASEKGPLDGSSFLFRNGWLIDQYPASSGAWGCPTGLCSWEGNEKGQPCYQLFGHCVPRHVLNDTMFGFTAALVGAPKFIQTLGANWAEGAANTPGGAKGEYGANLSGYFNAWWNSPDPEISRRCYELGNSLAEDWENEEWTTGPDLGQKIADGFKGFLDELLKSYPSLKSCVDCPTKKALKTWQRDWSRRSWALAGGGEAEPQAGPHVVGSELEDFPESDEKQ